ncbi:MAG: hypothetical protein HKO57_10390, partial [Akkermansiaceae bacterium]|nr:hypothetical protein [Akkermansiaceae bacterium]
MKPIRSSSRPGAALVIVVVLVTMLMVLILAFFSLSRLELRASRAYAESVTTNVLADSALNAVVAQIRDATSGLGTTQTWASQPGMIRRYDDKGELVNAFKLYSSASMVANSDFDPQDEVPPADWATETSLWVDLNEPVFFDRDGDGEFDDADGDGMDDAAFPIIHRAALDEVEGFDVDKNQIPGATDEQPLPMPVRWLYM